MSGGVSKTKHPASDTGEVRYELKGSVAHIILDRPDRLNALNDDLVRKLKAALAQFDGDEAAKVAILSGSGRAFSSGADVLQRQLRTPEEMKRLGRPAGRDVIGEGLLYDTLNWKPVIAAVHGYAMGFGLALMLECDLIVATHDAQLQVTEVSRGLWGSRHWALLNFKGNASFADEVVLTGRFFTGREAAAASVINRSVDQGQHIVEAEKLAAMMLENPDGALRAATRARRWYMQKYEESDQPLLRAGFPLHLTDEFRARVQSFADKHGHSQGSPDASVDTEP
jgi:enoyl-CoA hydratase/carnithine racemase